MGLSKRKLFATLCREAAACRACPELADTVAVMSELNGTLRPRVMFIAEAPGGHVDRTRRPFYGDRSGENFQTLLDSIELTRAEIFVTDAVMCSPRTTTDANRKPTRAEIRNCSAFLRRTVELIDPPVVATLGGVALGAIRIIEPHGLKLAADAGTPVHWFGRTLIPLYHPSPLVISVQRGLGVQLGHFQELRRVMSDK